MDIKKIKKEILDTPHMSFIKGKEITDFILKHKLKNILELGFHHGVSTCYLAGALDELGEGKITTIDLQYTKNIKPNIEELLKTLELSKYVHISYEPVSYIWRMMKMLDESPDPRFDLCYIDGTHDWYTDGFAFFLVDRLLKPGGWIIFDDLSWTYGKCDVLKNTDRVKNMPDEEKNTPQIKKVYELLVKPHPSYADFIIKDDWVYAHKLPNTPMNPVQIKQEIIYTGIKTTLINAVKKLTKSLSKVVKNFSSHSS